MLITILDVNKLNTIFSDNHDYSIDEFPNLKPLWAFEISTTTGALSGILGLIKLLTTTEGSTANKTLKNIQKLLDFACPAAAAGGGFLFNAPSLDSTVLAPILCTLDGISGTINFALNQIGKKEKFSEISLETIDFLQNYDNNHSF